MKLKQASLFFMGTLVATSAYAAPLPGGPISVDAYEWDGASSGYFKTGGTTAYLMYDDGYGDEPVQALGGNNSSVRLNPDWNWIDFATNLYQSPASNWFIDHGGQRYDITRWIISGAPEVTSVTSVVMNPGQLGTPLLRDASSVMLNYVSDNAGAPINWSVSLYAGSGELVREYMEFEDVGSGQLRVDFTEELLDSADYYLAVYFESTGDMSFTAESDGDVVLNGKLRNVTSYTYDVAFQTAAIPEPSTYALLAGLLAVGGIALKRRKK